MLLLEGAENVLEADQPDLAMSLRYSKISGGPVARKTADAMGAYDHW